VAKPLTASDLAGMAGTSETRIAALVTAGILPKDRDGRFTEGDIQRVRLVEALDQAGISLDLIARTIASGHLDFGFVDTALPTPSPLSSATFADEARVVGVPPETLVRLYSMWGLPRPQPDDLVREDDRALFREWMATASFGWIDESTLLWGARVIGESGRHIADWAVDFFRAKIMAPLREGGAPMQQVMDTAAQVNPIAIASLERVVLWQIRRILEHHILQFTVESIEAAIEESGVGEAKPAGLSAVAFLDLSGFTPLTEQIGDHAAAERAVRLAELVQETVPDRKGRVVKLLGDGVMLHFRDAAHSVPCGLELIREVASSDLPPARVGVSAGPLVARDGDYFGRTVNVAARILGVAGPGELIATTEAADQCRTPAIEFEAIGPVPLKGVSSPVPLFRATTVGEAMGSSA
jgi:adenylate cyclase